MTRLPQRPSELIDRARTLEFEFDGKPVAALEGDTIGSALAASGQQVLSRSFKYHRPRGLFCCSGQCPNCMVDVDGAPGVRACTEPARDGMKVRHLNAWPSLGFDAMRAVDRAGGRFTPPGFYYKTFMRPRRLWPLYERALRRAAGLGTLPDEPAERTLRTDHRTRHADLLVVGGGRAGLEAAIAAASDGADVVLADDGPALGGRLLWEGGHEEAAALAERALAAGVEVLSPGSALGWFDGLVPVSSGGVMHRIRATELVVATGAIPQPLPFTGNDLPGVMLAQGALRLAALVRRRAGPPRGGGDRRRRGRRGGALLSAAGVEVVAVIDSRAGEAVVAALGRSAVTGVRVAAIDADGKPDSTSREIACDLIVVAGGRAPAVSLLTQAGARVVYDERSAAFGSAGAPDGVRAAFSPSATSPADAHAARTSGPVLDSGGAKRCFVCLCEDVTDKDFGLAASEGFDSIELAKRYLTATMGPCQGRMCQLASARALARATGTDVAAIGTTTARPPWSTEPLATFAGRQHEPTSRSPLDDEHRRLGARMERAGGWQRPFDYGDAGAEALHVHEAAGVIDLSPLGKLIVRGPDAGAFLDRVYPNRLSNLQPLRLRYGVMLTEAGRIMDDGTVCRLDDETFYITTTTGGAAAVVRWLRWWLADWDLDVAITDVTATLGAVNLAGPRSRELLARLTELDLATADFPYLHARRAAVAGIEALILRTGFVGELGYEIHLPAAHLRSLWGAIRDTGRAVGLKPFGLEAQRLLRLEKQHAIVGQDTDSESNPFGAGMAWIVKLDKEDDFLGRWSAERAPEGLERLVGFTTAADDAPEEGAAVVVDGVPRGRVTSSRVSGALNRGVGMAWVPADLAGDGAALSFSSNGRVHAGTVANGPFYDPDGERQRA